MSMLCFLVSLAMSDSLVFRFHNRQCVPHTSQRQRPTDDKSTWIFETTMSLLQCETWVRPDQVISISEFPIDWIRTRGHLTLDSSSNALWIVHSVWCEITCNYVIRRNQIETSAVTGKLCFCRWSRDFVYALCKRGYSNWSGLENGTESAHCTNWKF